MIASPALVLSVTLLLFCAASKCSELIFAESFIDNVSSPAREVLQNTDIFCLIENHFCDSGKLSQFLWEDYVTSTQ